MTIQAIYKITNLTTGIIYVGSAIDLHCRWGQHRYELRRNKHKNKYLQHAWNKYGEDIFKFSIIERVQKEKLIEREQYWIDTLNCIVPNGYNLNPIAGSNLGRKWTQESKDKISKAKMGRKQSPEEIAKRIASNTGKKRSKESKAAMGVNRIGKPLSVEHRKKLSNAHRRPSKWPHENGCRCKCKECLQKKSDYQNNKNKLKRLNPNEITF